MNTLSMLILQIHEILNREDGQDLIEYALLVALISLAAVASISVLGTDISTFFANTATTLNNV
jgi:pilus assembly protein Flp/PilA